MPQTTSARKDQLALQQLRQALVSVAGLVGRPVLLSGGNEVGTIVDLVCRWDLSQSYPAIAGVIVRVGRRRSWVGMKRVAEIKRDSVVLGTSKLDLKDFALREGEALLMRDVVDHQMIDINGVRVVRAADLYIASVKDQYRLVGVDTSFSALLRRLGPARWRSVAAPKAVINWAQVQSFGQQSSGKGLQAASPMKELAHLRPGEVADLLEDLGRDERQELLEALDPEAAADALEEMQPKELEGLLREADLRDAAELVAHMEPDEAADALRDFGAQEREDLMQHLPKTAARQIDQVLAHDENEAGGLMTTTIMTAQAREKVADVRRRFQGLDHDAGELGAVIVVDAAGKLIDDIQVGELFVADPQQALSELTRPPEPVTVLPDTPLDEVVELLIAGRSSSIVVVDAEHRPIGRILADDIVDALISSRRGRFHFPRMLE